MTKRTAEYDRHAELVEKKFSSGLTPAEAAELDRLNKELDNIEAEYYQPIKDELQGSKGTMSERLTTLAETAFAYAQADSDYDRQRAETQARALCETAAQFEAWERLTVAIERELITDLETGAAWLRNQGV